MLRHPDDMDAPLLYLCDTTGCRITSSIALEDFQVWWEGDREIAQVSYAQHKVEQSLGIRYSAAEQQERQKGWRENLW